jgi:hypothetical protein
LLKIAMAFSERVAPDEMAAASAVQ